MSTTNGNSLISWLKPGGSNVFQDVKKMRIVAEGRGLELVNLGVGQPQGVPLSIAREEAAKVIMSNDQVVHEYQDNGTPGFPDFAKRFVQAHCFNNLSDYSHRLGFCAIPGIKPILIDVILACGPSDDKPLHVVTSTNPGYPTPATVCGYLGSNVINHEPELSPKNGFRFTFDQIGGLPSGSLLMANYPHNPTGQIMSREDWHLLCQFCVAKRIRLFNDSAYSALSHSLNHTTLADVAINYPSLSWLEAFSSSKLARNFTGWRIGAVVGSRDFVDDFIVIKGNMDSGIAAPLAFGVMKAFDEGRVDIVASQRMYQERLEMLIEALQSNGMQLSVYPRAGFFSLWKTPKVAFGIEIISASHFNELMIQPLQGSGIIGVHFPPYIRYAVCSEIAPNLSKIRDAFKFAKVSY